MRDKFSRSNLNGYGAAAHNFGTPASLELYRELMSIAEEIELCRARR